MNEELARGAKGKADTTDIGENVGGVDASTEPSLVER
jgi:hypothetical protein